MDLSRIIARNLCRIHGNARNYRTYYSRSQKIIKFPEMGRKIVSNCFGTSLWLLGLYNSDWPIEIQATTAGSLFLNNYTLCEEERGCLVAFLNPNSDFSDTSLFEHTGVYFSLDEKTRFMLHQPDIKMPFEVISLQDYLESNENRYLEPEFYCPVERK